MKIKVGDIVETDFGYGPVVAITDKWVIHKIGQTEEVAVSIGDNPIYLKVEGFEKGGGKQEIEIS